MPGTSRAHGESLSALQARRIALAAQGFGRARQPAGGEPGVGTLRDVGRRLHIFQIDPINVLVRSQYLPAFSRLGTYSHDLLDHLSYTERGMFEYVGHEWSLVAVECQPMLRWRMAAFASDRRWVRGMPPGYLDQVIAEVTEKGPMTPSELSEPGRRGDRFDTMPGKRTLHWLTQSGVVAVAGRRGLQQEYDLIERVIPAGILAAPTPDRDDARWALLLNSARALGVATAKDIVRELAKLYGVHRTTVSAHIARAGGTRGQLTEAQVDEAVRLYKQGWSLRAVGRHLDVTDKTVRRLLDIRGIAVRPRGRVPAGALAS